MPGTLPQLLDKLDRLLLADMAAHTGKADVPSCDGHRHLTTPRHYAYVKIAEGCDRHCAYCAIPIITGKHVSRPKAEILLEVRDMVAEGVKEFQIIAQELANSHEYQRIIGISS